MNHAMDGFGATAFAPGRSGTAVATAVATAAAARTRIVGFDVLRLTALTAVVAFHAGAPGAHYTTWRMPALTIITATLAAGRREARPLGEQARRSAARLLAPWLFWSAVYGAIEAASHLRFGVSILDELGPRALLIGTSLHLWYLPFAFVMVLAVSAIRRLTDGLSAARVGSLAVAVAFAAMVVVVLGGTYQSPEQAPLPQWLGVTPAAFLGLAVGALMGRLDARRLPVFATAVAAACVVLAVVLRDELPARYAVAMLMVAAASTWRFEPPRWLAELSGLGLGVYLVHMVVHRVVYATSNRMPTPDLPATGQALAVIALSFAAAWGLSRTPLKRFI